ncbi:MAG: extracellular solute-binding protein [Thermomicrobiales bacterium]
MNTKGGSMTLLKKNASRRQFLMGAAGGAALVGASWLPTRTDRIRAMQDSFDWKANSGSQVRLILNKHPYTESLLPLIPEFTELTGIEVPEPLILPEAEYFQKLLVDLSTGAGEFDVFMTGPQVHWAYDDAGWTEPLEGYLNDPNKTGPDYDAADLFEGLMAANRWDKTLGGGIGEGSQWAIPVMAETYVQAYRKDVYDELGIEPGATIEQWREANKKATQGDMKGIIVRGEKGGGMTATGWVSTFLGYGGVIMDEGLVTQFNSDIGVKLAEEYCASVKESGPEGWANVTWYEGQESFAAGGYGQYMDCDFFSAGYEDPDKSAVAGKVGLAHCPHAEDHDPVSGLWTWALAMSSQAQSKDASWAFIQWATMKDQMTVATVEGRNYNPTRASVFNDPAVQETMGSWANGTYLPVVLENLDKYARVAWPAQPETTFLTTAWDQALQEIWAGGDAKQALDNAKNNVDAHMKDLGLITE